MMETLKVKQVEERIFILSTLFQLIMTLAAGWAAFATKSLTLCIITAYYFCDFLIDILGIAVAKKININQSKDFHFGYGKLESIYVFLQGSFIFAICIISFILGIQHLIFRNVVIQQKEIAVFYSIFEIIVSVILWIVFRKYYKKYPTELLRSSTSSSLVEIYLALFMFIAFTLMIFLEQTYFKHYVVFIDPILSIIISLVLIVEPIKLAHEGMREILDMSPGFHEEEKIMQEVKKYLQEHHENESVSLRLRKAGRKRIVALHFYLPKNYSFEQIYHFNQGLSEFLSAKFSHLTVACHPEPH